MENKNKPKVFLSHSKKDISFINKIYDDLRKCQIDTWKDDIDIRHGKPWLDEIFRYGIPNCDCILVYVTDNSIKSEMVKKEIDASVIQKLKDNNVAFIPYVSSTEIRDKLRSDIQALQAPEWNDSNYSEVLPKVVAEIWRSYLERTVQTAVSNEKVNRLQAELELKELKSKKNESMFTDGEIKDYEYIYNALNKIEQIEINLKFFNKEKIKELKDVTKKFFAINVVSLIPFISSADSINYYFDSINDLLIDKIYEIENKQGNSVSSYEIINSINISNELLMFGFITRVYVPAPQKNDRMTSLLQHHLHDENKLIYSEKIERFKYWMAMNDKLPEEIIIRKAKE